MKRATKRFLGLDSLESRMLLSGVLEVVPAMTLAVTPAAINENESLTLNGDLATPLLYDHDVTIQWGDGASTVLTLAAGETEFTMAHQYLDDPVDPAVDFTINVAVADAEVGTGTASTLVTVLNVAPVVTGLTSSAAGVGDAKENMPMTLTGTFADVGTLDTHTAVIDWGDGTTSAAVIVESGGAGTLSGTHTYVAGGIYSISVTLTDDDAGAATGSSLAVITGVGIHDGVLQVIGTHRNDSVSINQTGNGKVKVHATFLRDRGKTRTLDFASVQSIEVLLGNGNDKGSIAGNIDKVQLLDGGNGNDMLNAGGGPAILIGGAGNDKLRGSKSGDILIGGAGVDNLNGGPGDDALIGGRSLFDPNDNALTADFDTALLALLSEWTSGRDYATRVANLSGTGTGERLNGDYFLQTGVTVLGIQKGDKLIGSSGDNWYVDLVTHKSNGAATAGGNGNSDNAPGKNK